MKTFWWFLVAVLGVCVLSAPVSDIHAKFAKKFGLNKARSCGNEQCVVPDPTAEKFKRSPLNNQPSLSNDAVKKRVVYYPEFVDVEYYDHSNNVLRDKFYIDEWDKEDATDCDGFLLDGNKDLSAKQIFDLIGAYPETDDFDDFEHVITNILDKVDYLNEEEQEKLMTKLEKYLNDDGDWERIVEAIHSEKVTDALIAEPDKQRQICIASRISHGIVNEGNEDINTAADNDIPIDEEVLFVEGDDTDIADEEVGVVDDLLEDLNEDIDAALINEEDEVAIEVVVNDDADIVGEEVGDVIQEEVDDDADAVIIAQGEEEEQEVAADEFYIFDVGTADEEVGIVDDIDEVIISQEEEEEEDPLEANEGVVVNNDDILIGDIIAADDVVNADTVPDVVEEAVIVDEQPIVNEVNLETINGEIFFIEFPNQSNEKPYKPSDVETQIIKPINYKPIPQHHHVPVKETNVKLLPQKQAHLSLKPSKVSKVDVVIEKPPLSEAKRDLGIELQKVSDKKQRMNLLYNYLAERIKYAVKEVGSHVDDDIELESPKDIEEIVEDKKEVEFIDYEYKILEPLSTPHSPTYVTNNIQQFSQQVPTNIGSHTSQMVQPTANLQPHPVMQPAPFVQLRQLIQHPDGSLNQFQSQHPQQYSLYSPYAQLYPNIQTAAVTDLPTTPYPLDNSVHPTMASYLTQLLGAPTVLPPYHYEPFTNHERIMHINDGSSTVRNNPHTYNPVNMVQEVGRN